MKLAHAHIASFELQSLLVCDACAWTQTTGTQTITWGCYIKSDVSPAHTHTHTHKRARGFLSDVILTRTLMDVIKSDVCGLVCVSVCVHVLDSRSGTAGTDRVGRSHLIGQLVGALLHV